MIKKMVSVSFLVFLFSLIFVLFGTLSAKADDANPGTAFTSMSAPGTFQAENFNNGGQYAAYYATTLGNQGNSTYRSTDVDIYTDGTNIYIQSSGTREYLKYTFNVATAGWFQITYTAKQPVGSSNPNNFVTLIDDRQLGNSDPIPVQSTFATVNGVSAVYLTAGSHVLNMTMRVSGTAVDSITLTSIAAPQALTPQIVATASTDEVVVADAVVTNSPYNADYTGINDSTAGIQNALNDVGKMGGGTVFIPVGKYRLEGTISIPSNVTLRGDWASPLGAGNGGGTILKATFGQGNANATPFITLAGPNGALKNVSIWYPNQSASSVSVYPYSIYGKPNAYAVTLMNITLYDSYKGMDIAGAGAGVIGNIYGTALSNGIRSYGSYEYSHMFNVNFQNSIWQSAPASVITNTPTSPTDQTNLNNYTTANLVGVQFGTNDGEEIYGITVQNAFQGILFKMGPNDTHAFYGAISKINATITEVDTYPGIHYINTDKVSGTAGLSYAFASNRKPASATNFYNVKSYGAVGNGITDDTSAIQSALNAAGTAGGGTVYLPQGQYKLLGNLSVPTGVELRGAYGASHNDEDVDTTTLLAYQGKGTATSDTDTAFISLNANSGIRGFSIVYPQQGYGDTNFPISAYPYTVRSLGIGVWIEDMNLQNSYKGIDFSTNRSDDHLVMGLWETAFQTGIVVGGGSIGGVIERSDITYGNWYQDYRYNSPHDYGYNTILAYTKANTLPYIFGGSSNETTLGLNSFMVYIGVKFRSDGSGSPQNFTFWQPSSDSSGLAGYDFEAGGTTGSLNLIGVADGGSAGNGITSLTSFTGTANIYDEYHWANTSNTSINGGTVNIFTETALSNAGFEAPATTTYVYGPLTNGWTFDASSGVQHNGSAWGAATAPEGVQTAFIQNGGTISQSVTFSAGTYTVGFQAAKRTAGGTQSFSVYYDTTLIGSFTPSLTSFSSFSTSSFTATAGSHTIKFVGTNTVGDNTDFIDAVTLQTGNNLALNKTATMTATPYTGYGADQSVDGNITTYAQANTNVLWNFQVDLGSSMTVGRAAVTEDASNYATAYSIQVSTDNINWTTVATQSSGVGGQTTYTFTPISARYVKMNVTAATGTFAHALDEFEVYAN